MTVKTASPCGCIEEIWGGKKARRECEHGNPFLGKQLGRSPAPSFPTVIGASPRRCSSLKRSEPKRDWSDARAKVDEEGCCRICKRSGRPLEAAHVLGREHDEPKLGKDGWPLKELYVERDRIFPACGPFPDNCHGDVDHNRINYLPFLTLDEQLQAVRDAGGIDPARMRLAPVEHREEAEVHSYRECLEPESSRGAVA